MDMPRVRIHNIRSWRDSLLFDENDVYQKEDKNTCVFVCLYAILSVHVHVCHFTICMHVLRVYVCMQILRIQYP
jgi:hypothetical protein